MTIYTISIITSTGYPYYTLRIKNLPSGIKLFLRFYDFTPDFQFQMENADENVLFDLNAGLISALFEFARNLDKKIDVLQFKSKESKDIENANKYYEGDVLITTQTEIYLLDTSVRKKIELIYDTIIKKKIPIEMADRINTAEEQKIVDILLDNVARKHLTDNRGEIGIIAEDFLSEMLEYGLESIAITSFDLSPIIVFGNKYSFTEIEILLRNMGEIPIIEPLQWKHRQSFYKGTQVWVYIINSGIGVTADGLFEPFFYLLFTSEDSFLGEFPLKLTQAFNIVLG